MEKLYSYSVKDTKGNEVLLENYKGKVLLIVNTATKCGYTPQYDELQELYDKYKSLGFEILDFPCNQFGAQSPENDSEIEGVCNLNFGITFKIFSKVDVNGEQASDLFKYLRRVAPNAIESEESYALYNRLQEKRGFITSGNEIKWNFTKFLINRDGSIIKRFAPTDKPLSFEKEIEKLLK